MTRFNSTNPNSANFNPKDSEYLSKLQDYYADWKSIPSYAKLCEVFGIASKSWVKSVLDRLNTAGFIERTPDGAWIPTRHFFARPLAESTVQAGMPVSVTDTQGDYFVIDEMLIDTPSRTTLITVKGDSMIEAGIHEGDVAVVEKRLTANIGDIVVAIVDNDFTLKTLDKENGNFILRPANPAFPIIRPHGTLEIFGVLTGLVRKYRR
ncbi:MAG: LexA family transcriptional repressor [Gallionellaceae bacterium CG1_02_56_997]|nr:LexA family transcriptional regulator [Gallionella sp.]OIO82167.1 MAG: LexA family transcriptional repressor [Gallionellaceae bacterium CG1_02_56_997]PIV15658.1 MAG: LexA family transcriptional repressor [Gallionellales bacterium CG03_land_8_20_14_0_80_55_15]HCJ50768.1 LexA family transcriptional repressor [Gallionella sp.]